MKRKKHHVISLAALLMSGVAFAACSSSSDDITEPASAQPANGKYTLTVNASKGGAIREQNGIRSSSAEAQPALGKAKAVDATTRALSLDGNTLNATWKAGEKVTVLKPQKMPLTVFVQPSLSNPTWGAKRSAPCKHSRPHLVCNERVPLYL